MRRRLYVMDDGHPVHWTGVLELPNIHALYRTFFNAVDVHNKLALGPRSTASLATNSLLLKVWLATLCMASANGYQMYLKAKKLTTDTYSHSDFKMDVSNGLMKLIAKQSADVAENENNEVFSSRTRSANQEGTKDKIRTVMPAACKDHNLSRDTSKNRRCIICGHFTKSGCECGRAVCGTSMGVTCWAHHLMTVVHGTVDSAPLQWPRGKKMRHSV
jgi:hypothetical protein